MAGKCCCGLGKNCVGATLHRRLRALSKQIWSRLTVTFRRFDRPPSLPAACDLRLEREHVDKYATAMRIVNRLDAEGRVGSR